MNFDGKSYKVGGGSGGGGGRGYGRSFHDRSTGVVGYGGIRYDPVKSSRNRAFMNSFENEFNRGFRPKYQFNNTVSKF